MKNRHLKQGGQPLIDDTSVSVSDTVFRISMEGDNLYYAAESEDGAFAKFEPTYGVPRELLTFTKMRRADVPSGEEVL